jgi:hypothetical protein
VDPFTLAMMAISTVKQGVAMYKDFKATGKEAYEVMQEISGGLGKFFEHNEKAKEDLKEKEKNPPVGKSLQAQALENVLARKQLEQAEYDLRQMLVYEAPPELGALWTEFEAERNKLKADQKKFDLAQKKRMKLREGTGKKELPYGILGLHYALQSWYLPSPLLE